MRTKYDIGDKVVLKALVSGISVTNDGVVYCLTVFDGEAGWNNHINIKESMLTRMNEVKGADDDIH